MKDSSREIKAVILVMTHSAYDALRAFIFAPLLPIVVIALRMAKTVFPG